MTLYDLAPVVRSKNAGPFTLTVDLMFASAADYERVLRSSSFTAKAIADLYGVEPDTVAICPFARVRTIKVTLPRPRPAGAPGDPDVYGCQQHFPLAAVEV